MRALRLTKDRLAELTPAELTEARAGNGTHVTCYTGLTYCGFPCVIQSPTRGCTSDE